MSSSSSSASSQLDCDSIYNPEIPLLLPNVRNSQQQQLQHSIPADTPNLVPIRTVAAPMVAASDYAFRSLVRQHHADLTFTQMLHARNLISDKTFYKSHWDLWEFLNIPDPTSSSGISEAPRLLLPAQRNLLGEDDDAFGDASHPHPPPNPEATRGPVIVQLAGHAVNPVVQAALKLVESTHGQLTGIDFNLGCPQGIARKGRYGAFLMQDDPVLVATILSALRRALPKIVTVSAKIRLPLTPTEQSERLRRLCDSGIDFVTIHGRDLTENKTTVSAVRLERLTRAVATVHEHAGIPVIVNGGIETAHDIEALLRTTKAAAVMSSEALLERPTLFRDYHALYPYKCHHSDQRNTNGMANSKQTQQPYVMGTISSTPRERFDEQCHSARTYLHWCRYAPPVPGVLGIQGGSFNVVRGHLFKILYRYTNEHIDLRDKLADSFSLQRLSQAEELLQTLQIRYHDLTDVEWDALPSSQYPASSWYRRHWKTSDLSTSLEHTINLSGDSLDERKQLARARIAALKERKQKATAANL